MATQTIEHEPALLVSPEVIQRACGGDPEAFRELVLSCRRRVFGTIGRLIGRPEDVEDVAQEVFVRLHQSLGQLRAPELFGPWLHRITVNATTDYLRRRRRSREIRLADLGDEQAHSVLQSAATRDGGEERYRRRVREQVDNMLSRIPVKDRVLLVLKEIEGLSLKELERIYQVDSNCLKRRLFLARQRTLKAMQAAPPREGQRRAVRACAPGC